MRREDLREQPGLFSPQVRRASKTANYPSASPHRAGFHAGLHPEDAPSSSTEWEEEDDSYYETRLPSSARRYHTTNGSQVIEQGNRRLVIHQGPPRTTRRRHWAWLFVGGMVVMLVLFVGLQLLANWWSQHQLDSTYGFPRTYQTDAVVYQGDTFQHPSHYLFLNLQGTVIIIELPHGDSSHARIYTGPTLYSPDAALIPVTGEFTQVNGKEEMLVHIQTRTIVYVNNGTQFLPQ